MKAKRLGRGLSGLITRTEAPEQVVPVERRTPVEPSPTKARDPEGLRVGIDDILPNPFQPRRNFAQDELESLQASITEHGILQPLVVRRAAGGYEVIAGERRLRAARELGLAQVPVVIRDATDEQMQVLALVENLQRVDLNAMEKARAMTSMMRNFAWTQEQVAAAVGKARATIANMVRLLDLPEPIQRMVEQGQLTGAQGRAVLQAEGTDRRLRLARLAHHRGLSVRDIERRARRGPTIGKRRLSEPDPYVHDLEQRMTRALSTRVRMSMKGKAGTIAIEFADGNELDRLLERLT